MKSQLLVVAVAAIWILPSSGYLDVEPGCCSITCCPSACGGECDAPPSRCIRFRNHPGCNDGTLTTKLTTPSTTTPIIGPVIRNVSHTTTTESAIIPDTESANDGWNSKILIFVLAITVPLLLFLIIVMAYALWSSSRRRHFEVYTAQ